MDDVIPFHGLNASKIAGKAQQLKERGDLQGRVGAEYSNARDITAGSVEGMRAYSKMAHKKRNLAA
jgi:hypothetical protein